MASSYTALLDWSPAPGLTCTERLSPSGWRQQDCSKPFPLGSCGDRQPAVKQGKACDRKILSQATREASKKADAKSTGSFSKGRANTSTLEDVASSAPKQAEPGGQIVTSLPEVPVTQNFPVPEDLDQVIPNPGLPRANNTPTLDYPDGLAESDQMKKFNNGAGRTVLQQHVDFFDTDEDGIIYPIDTFRGFRSMGYNPVLSALAGFFINSAMSFATNQNPIPDLRLPVYTANIHKAKHGSDSEVYDTEGRFVPQKFEEIFTKFDADRKGALTWTELQNMVAHNRNLYDGFGALASQLEWAVTWILAKEVGPDGREIMTREAIRAQYDGSLFYRKAAERELAKKAKHKK